MRGDAFSNVSFKQPESAPIAEHMQPSVCCCFAQSVMFNSLRPPWTAAFQAYLSFTIFLSFLKLMSIKFVILSNHLILCTLFSCSQSFPASESFPMSQLFTSCGQSIQASASASALPMNIQGWFTLGLIGLILLSKGHSRVFSSTTAQKHQFFGAHFLLNFRLMLNSHIHTWLPE